MRSIVIIVAALVVAGNAFAQDHDVVHAGMVRQMNAHEDQDNVVHAGMVRQYQALQRQVATVRRKQAAAEKALAGCEEKAVKAGKAKNAFAARLGACIAKLREVKNLAEQAKRDEERLSNLEGRMDALEDRTGLIEEKVVAHERRADMVEEAVVDNRVRIVALEERGGDEAELVLGLVNHRDGLGFALGAGFALPVAKGDARLQAEALGSFGSEALGFTAIGRGLAELGWGFVLGLNVRFHLEGPAFSRPANTVFVGAGGSLGWQYRRFGVIADVSFGPEAHRVGQTDAKWVSSLLGQVKF